MWSIIEKISLSQYLMKKGRTILFFVSVFFYVVPIALLDLHRALELLIIVACLLFYPVSYGVYIWALVNTVQGPQDVVAILFYIAFGLYLIVSFRVIRMKRLFDKLNSDTTEEDKRHQEMMLERLGK